MLHCLPLKTLLRTLRARAAVVLPLLALSLAGPAGAQVVISQVYGAGGNTGATYKSDYVELHNKGASAISLSGWSLQYASAGGVPNTGQTTALSGTIPPGGFLLVGFASGTAGVAITADITNTSTNMSASVGKLALVSGTTEPLSGTAANPTGLSGTSCPTVTAGVKIEDYVGWGSAASCSKTSPALPHSVTSSIVRGSYGNSCLDANNNSADFAVLPAPMNPRNSFSAVQLCSAPCGPGIAFTTTPTALWQQFSLACVPAGTSTVDAVLGGGTAGKFNSTNYDTRWSIWKRNATNTGNVQMALADTITTGTGHWIKSLDAPAGGTLVINSAQASATTLTTSVTGCQATNAQGGCVVLPVPSATAGSRMIANPLPYDIDWSKVRVRVNGTVYTPTAAQTALLLSKQLWIYNGTSYATWSDTSPNIGNLQYFKSFFVKVLASGVGQTIDLLVPALGSTIPPASAAPLASAVAPADAQAPARPTLAKRADSTASGEGWLVDLLLHNVDTGWQASAKLGQWPGATDKADADDLATMAPFAQPYLTVVFPHPEWRGEITELSADLRADTGYADKWDFEVRAQPLGSNVVLRWNAPAAVLAKSRLIDRDTGQVLYPARAAEGSGYPMTLDTPVRRLTWEYMGN